MSNEPSADQLASSKPPGRVLHLAERDALAAMMADGQYTGSTRGYGLDEVGFVHMSTTGQLPGVMAYLFADVPPEDLVLLVVDLATLTSHGIEVRWEHAEDGAEPYPHVYGPVPLDAIVATLPLVDVELKDLVELSVR